MISSLSQPCHSVLRMNLIGLGYALDIGGVVAAMTKSDPDAAGERVSYGHPWLTEQHYEVDNVCVGVFYWHRACSGWRVEFIYPTIWSAHGR